ncbi:hypothetical protein GEMRC1_011578 [Eukaryota sp. GEM-RC1]
MSSSDDLYQLRIKISNLDNENQLLNDTVSDLQQSSKVLKSRADVTTRLTEQLISLVVDLSDETTAHDLSNLSPLHIFDRLRSQIKTLFAFKTKFDVELDNRSKQRQLIDSNSTKSLEGKVKQQQVIIDDLEKKLTDSCNDCNNLRDLNRQLQTSLDQFHHEAAEKETRFRSKVKTLSDQNKDLTHQYKTVSTKLNYQELRLMRIEQLESALSVEKLKEIN